MSPAEEAAHPLSDTQIADNAVKMLKQFQARGLENPFFLACGFRTCHRLPRISSLTLTRLSHAADRPHLPFVAPAAKFDLYPEAEVKLPADQQPPTDMPLVAWSNSGELLMYSDIKTLRNDSALQPGQVLPQGTVRSLRRAYYSAVSHMDDQLGKVMAALSSSGFKHDTVVSFWGDQYAICPL